MLVAARAEFVSRFAKAWRGMGFTGPILVPTECEGLPTDLPGIETGAFADLVRKADLFIFEFGLATQTAGRTGADGADARASSTTRY